MKTISLNQKTIIYIVLAFIFSVTVRLIWVYQFSDTDSYKFNNQFMINTNDGYFWAEGARDIISGVSQQNDLSPISTATANFTAMVYKILPFSFESVLFYLPAILSSLIVIPIILIGRTINQIEVGFIAALLASITWSYYNRTMVGYFDTDMLNIVFPMILLFGLIWAIDTKKNIYILVTSFDIIAYRWWYPQSYSLEFAFWGLIVAYIIYQYIKKEEYRYSLILISFMMIAMVNLDSYIRVSIVVILFLLLQYKKEIIDRYLWYIVGISFLIFLATGGFDPIWKQLKGYVFKDLVSARGVELNLHFFTVMQTIKEAGAIPFDVFANRISGHSSIFLLSLVGYIWLAIRYPIMILGLPMVGLGFLANGFFGVIPSGGLRFTIYAVPILALGVAFLIVQVSKKLSALFLDDRVEKLSKPVFMSIFTIAILAPNISHVIDYRVSPVFNNQEVKVLDKLKNIASREDYVISWWDYGYPIRYYSDVKTLADGGKHSGAVNFPLSFILTYPQPFGAKMARLDVEYTEKRFKIQNDEDNTTNFEPSNIGQMTIDYGYKDTNSFITSLQTDIKLPKKSREIYIYLPNRMMSIYPTITHFSNIDLMSGQRGQRPFFYLSKRFSQDKNYIDLGKNIKISKKDNMLIVGGKKYRVNNFAKTFYQNGVLKTQLQRDDRRSNINIIYMSNYKQFLVVDNSVYYSLYFQLFVFENYDRRLFEPTILTPLAKVYKLKI
jgi:undecaprenyl-diphosphooligosaccharide--protein glycosyltransferase